MRRRSVSTTTERRCRPARRRPASRIRDDREVGRPCERRVQTVRWRGRRPRQVYRVFDEHEFLGEDWRADAMDSDAPTAEHPRPGGGHGGHPLNDGSRRRPAQIVGAAFALIAIVAAGVIARDAIAPFRRGRLRPVAGSRLSSLPPRPPARRQGEQMRTRAGTLRHRMARGRGEPRPARTRVGARRPLLAMPGRTSEFPAGSMPATVPNEFSFERRLVR